MKSCKINLKGEMMDFQASEIGLIVWILNYKLWGKILVNGKLYSESWWGNRLQLLIKRPEIVIENHWDCGIIEKSSPIPFEIECGIPHLNYEMLSKIWKR